MVATSAAADLHAISAQWAGGVGVGVGVGGLMDGLICRHCPAFSGGVISPQKAPKETRKPQTTHSLRLAFHHPPPLSPSSSSSSSSSGSCCSPTRACSLIVVDFEDFSSHLMDELVLGGAELPSCFFFRRRPRVRQRPSTVLRRRPIGKRAADTTK